MGERSDRMGKFQGTSEEMKAEAKAEVKEKHKAKAKAEAKEKHNFVRK